jgi:type IV pilus assembly protein PilA
MIVVAIVGILAVLGIYGVRKYLANAKTAEARNSIGQMSKDAATAYERESMTGAVLAVSSAAGFSRSLCTTTTKSVPSSSAKVQGSKYQSDVSEWNLQASTNGGFSCLKFSMDQPQYYMYSYTSSGAGSSGSVFTAIANGDLNGDQNMSTFSIQGAINASLALNVAPNMIEQFPEE